MLLDPIALCAIVDFAEYVAALLAGSHAKRCGRFLGLSMGCSAEG